MRHFLPALMLVMWFSVSAAHAAKIVVWNATDNNIRVSGNWHGAFGASKSATVNVSPRTSNFIDTLFYEMSFSVQGKSGGTVKSTDSWAVVYDGGISKRYSLLDPAPPLLMAEIFAKRAADAAKKLAQTVDNQVVKPVVNTVNAVVEGINEAPKLIAQFAKLGAAYAQAPARFTSYIAPTKVNKVIDQDCKFFVIGDTHFGAPGDNASDEYYHFQKTVPGTMVQMATKDRTIKALIHCGDLTQKDHPEAELAAFKQQYFTPLKQLGVRLFAVMGNHDSWAGYTPLNDFLKNSISEGFGNPAKYPGVENPWVYLNSPVWKEYTKKFRNAHSAINWDQIMLGGFYNVADIGSARFIFLGLYPNGRAATPPMLPRMLDWLKTDLAATPKDKPLVMVMHYDLKAEGGADNHSRDWVDEEKEEFWQAIKNHNVKAIFCGHIHKTTTDFKFHGIPVYTASGDKDSSNGFLLCTLNKGNITVEKKSLNSH